MKQLVQLQEHYPAFEQAGIGVVSITYDAPQVQQKFIEKYHIAFPLISDIDATTVTALGIINTKYQPGDDHYGIPHPGVYVLNPQMQIVGKIFIEAFSTRVDAQGVLNYAQAVLDSN